MVIVCSVPHKMEMKINVSPKICIKEKSFFQITNKQQNALTLKILEIYQLIQEMGKPNDNRTIKNEWETNLSSHLKMRFMKIHTC